MLFEAAILFELVYEKPLTLLYFGLCGHATTTHTHTHLTHTHLTHTAPMRLPTLLLLTSPLALLASSSWTITPHPDGSLDLTFGTEILLKGGCPAVVIPPSTTKTSLCAGANWTAAASPPTAGVDPSLGPYTATTISYTPTAAAPTRPTAAAPATVLPAAALELRAFDDAKHDRVIHAQVRAQCVRTVAW